MQNAPPGRRDPYRILLNALAEDWQTIDTIPLKGEGPFWVLTLSGLVRLAHNRKSFRKARKADGYGPMRTTVVAVKSANYLAAIAWKPAEAEVDAEPPG